MSSLHHLRQLDQASTRQSATEHCSTNQPVPSTAPAAHTETRLPAEYVCKTAMQADSSQTVSQQRLETETLVPIEYV